MISQVESGLSTPSVGTLWAIVTELNLSLDRVFRGEAFSGDAPPPEPAAEMSPTPILHPENRQTIDLASGVKWEDLTAISGDGVDFVLATYEVGGASTPDESLMRHHGQEYGYVMTGTLGVQIGFREYVLKPGDAIAFDSNLPHRLRNFGNTAVQAIWFVIGRGADDKVGSAG
jgi:mannose-6-phosphate isomerase-like protein (cupin superfamily)